MVLNTQISDNLDINPPKTTVLDGQAQITFDQNRNNRGVTQGSFKGLSLAFSPSQFTVDAPIYENVKDAYSNDEGTNQSKWKVPKNDPLVSLGVVTYTNELISGEDGNDSGNSQSIIGGGKLGITINDPVGVTQKITFPIRIYDQLEGPETIALKSTNRPFKFLIKGTPIYFDYIGGKPISNATGVDTPTQYKEADPGLEDLSFNFEVQDGTTAQIELFGRFYTTEDLPDPAIITSISEDTGVPGDFRTSDNTLLINGTAEPLSEVSVFLDSEKIGTTNTDITGSWSLDRTGTKLSDGTYELTATAIDLEGNASSTNKSQLLEIDSDFHIEVDDSDPNLTDEAREKIQDAVDFWEKIIANDIPDVNDPSVGGLVDDLKVKINVNTNSTADLGNTSGYKHRQPSIDPLTGAPSSSPGLPYYAEIFFELDDLKTPQGIHTIKHKLGHALGFNQETFGNKGLITPIPGYQDTYGFNGSNAYAAYKTVGGPTHKHNTVPLDETASHWHEWLFPDDFGNEGTEGLNSAGDELMSKQPAKNKYPFLSELTVGVLKDLGYEIEPNYQADAITMETGVYLYSSSPLLNIPY
ncbi:hypothetical protein Riv7116_2952 [Rivularia sp. PCC 7116]|uniref:Ig-like domain-containing protein n=1 Tax=Rivularia sp. PCC 7116 TaxID=373994 RepID=UPI00029EEAC9|nr:Ig-like domain-containing protein [Rivularia sp. PCC 7116]AFY55433.1 hypothetical protein Riv7116_2952 [Rivularia sp. PCC 7116]